MISLRTNVDSLNAQMNLKLNSNFQSKTIQQLTSGYRINSSGDDAAGLAIANAFRSNITELQQGVSNANDGVGQLQIIDGGLSNISTLLDRMKTLATQSASGTFAGDRGTLNQEYSQLVSEITRQASNINLNSGGSLNTTLNVYIGGANTSSAAGISIDLSGAKNAVDATSLGLGGTNVLGGTFTGIAGNNQVITTPGALFVKGTAGTNDQTFALNYIDSNGNAQSKTLTVAASTNGSSLSQVLNSLNTQLSGTGVLAGTDSNGYLQFTGSNAFAIKDNGTSGTAALTAGSTSGATNANANNYLAKAGTAFVAHASGESDTLTFTLASGATVTATVDDTATTAAQAVAQINAKTAQSGIYALEDPNNSGNIIFQSTSSFTLKDVSTEAAKGTFGASSVTAAAGYVPSVTAPSSTNMGANAQAAITAINAAVKALGLVQGVVGAGENKLQYAINLAQSQISSFSAAESQIRDADVAAQAANLTKSQVLQQTSIAAMAQANQIPQAVLKLLQ